MTVAICKEIYAGVILRTATEADIPQLMRLEGSIEDVEGLSKWNVARWLYEVKNNYVWLIEQNREVIYVVGFIHDSDKREIDVIKLTAGPSGRPWTSKLIQAGAPVLSTMGIERIRGRCADHLLEFYNKLGFVSIGVIPHYFGLGLQAHSIERML